MLAMGEPVLSQVVAAAKVVVPTRLEGTGSPPTLILTVRKFVGEASAIDSFDKTYADFAALRGTLGSRALPFPTRTTFEGSTDMRERAAEQLTRYMRHVLQKPLDARKLQQLHRFLMPGEAVFTS